MIRDACADDLQAIMSIYNSEIVSNTSVYQDSLYTKETISEWFEQKKASGWPVYVWVAQDVPVAFATYGTFRSRELYRSTVEHSVFVQKEHRGIGIASKMMQKLIGDARARGFHCMIGGIDSENSDSIAFHERLGFKEVGHIPEVAWKFDRWLDLKLYQLIL